MSAGMNSLIANPRGRSMHWHGIADIIIPPIVSRIGMYLGIAATFLGGAMLAQAPPANAPPVVTVPHGQPGVTVMTDPSAAPSPTNPVNISPGWAGILTAVSGMLFAYLSYRTNEKEKDRQARREEQNYNQKFEELKSQKEQAMAEAMEAKNKAEALEKKIEFVAGFQTEVQNNSLKISSTNAKTSEISDKLEEMKKYLREKKIIKEEDPDCKHSKVNVLLVEDETTASFAMTLLLNKECIEVTTCTSVNEAKVLLGHMVFGAVVMDILLPDGRGTEILQFIRDNKLPCRTVVVTATEDQAEIDKIMKMGPSGFIKKPFVFRKIVDSIRGQ
jgi:CheY-like chemotaxis protein